MNRLENVGGQAVIEGVMMRSKSHYVVAVRKPNGEISVKSEPIKSIASRLPILGKPFLRGIVVLIESLVIGMKALTFSANEAVEEDEKGKRMSNFAMAMTLIVSLALGIGLFIVLPAFLAGEITERGWTFNIVDGVLRLAFFLCYILVISLMPDIKRVFQYHGAEHKSIYTYESGMELSHENAASHSTLHPRCGTAFLLMVMVVGILVFSILGRPSSILVRLGSRVLLIPLIAGISYEINRFAAKRCENRFVRVLIAPGLALQKLTTKEPTPDQVEVALHSLKSLISLEEANDIS